MKQKPTGHKTVIICRRMNVPESEIDQALNQRLVVFNPFNTESYLRFEHVETFRVLVDRKESPRVISREQFMEDCWKMSAFFTGTYPWMYYDTQDDVFIFGPIKYQVRKAIKNSILGLTAVQLFQSKQTNMPCGMGQQEPFLPTELVRNIVSYAAAREQPRIL